MLRLKAMSIWALAVSGAKLVMISLDRAAGPLFVAVCLAPTRNCWRQIAPAIAYPLQNDGMALRGWLLGYDPSLQAFVSLGGKCPSIPRVVLACLALGGQPAGCGQGLPSLELVGGQLKFLSSLIILWTPLMPSERIVAVECWSHNFR